MKQCTKCHIWKDTVLFPRRYDRERGWQAHCKQCKKIRAREYYRRHPGRKSKNPPGYMKKYRAQYIRTQPARYVDRILFSLLTRMGKKGFCPLPQYMSAAKQFLLDSLKTPTLVCPYTGEPLRIGVNTSLDHKIPVSRRLDLALVTDNLQIVSMTYNQAKWKMTDEEFNQKYILRYRSPETESESAF